MHRFQLHPRLTLSFTLSFICLSASPASIILEVVCLSSTCQLGNAPPLPLRHLPLLTLQSHHAADHNDVASSPFLHVRHHLLDHADHPEEVGLEHFLHVLDGDALHRAHQADARVIDWFGGRKEGGMMTLSCCSSMMKIRVTH